MPSNTVEDQPDQGGVPIDRLLEDPLHEDVAIADAVSPGLVLDLGLAVEELAELRRERLALGPSPGLPLWPGLNWVSLLGKCHTKYLP